MSSSKHTKIKERQLLAQPNVLVSLLQVTVVVVNVLAAIPNATLALQALRSGRNSQEAYARRMRLRKQQKALKTRGAEMLRRGLQNLDELDEAEEKERKEAEAKESFPHSPPTTDLGGAVSEHDYLSALSPGFFERWGVDGGTPPATLGS
ncbi:hypothetical protein VE01_03805 [Pseudogymnoascus verrucosus]|uniref:Uncharacterized protein n=1 Tax=Pseudogymnoascus verrucosus TaxID=342668 RepID=A0A1B8GQM8_9PEZI|nr:uncharacterized protein VE01_03805 [Pseudogymnoascus verrucosus]OBT98136.1 hypothetical protein VE01_03805 [Pseudogymnoascus verrucosus]